MEIPPELIVAYSPLVAVLLCMGVLLANEAAAGQPVREPEGPVEEGPGDTVPIPVRRQP